MKSQVQDLALFTDASADPIRRVGVGVYVVVPASSLKNCCGEIRRTELVRQLKVKRFDDTSSTTLELQTVLWAVTEVRQGLQGKLTIYSDSQCISGLLARKPRLLADGFVSKRTGKLLGNASLYRTFYELHDQLGFRVIKVAGHSPSRDHDAEKKIFSYVDRAAGKALKVWLKEIAGEHPGTDCSRWCVYVLRCSNNSLYIGITNNLANRLEKHQFGIGSKFVRSFRPFELVSTVPCRDAAEARRLEYDLKRLTRKEKIEVLGICIDPVTSL